VEETVVAALVNKFALRVAVLANVFTPSVTLRVLRAFLICPGMLSKPVTVVEVMVLLFLVVMCASLLMVVVVSCLMLVAPMSAIHGGSALRLTMVVVFCFMLVVPVSANRGGATNSMDVVSDEVSACERIVFFFSALAVRTLSSCVSVRL
jgi:hypothetical protein